jgi:hypothetical protein
MNPVNDFAWPARRGKFPAREPRKAIGVALIAAGLCWSLTAGAEPGSPPRLYTNQAFVEESTVAPTLPISNPIAVFDFVLRNLPDRVKIYPTENYYYFSFTHNHVRYAGNIRLDAQDRDRGKVNFAYYPDLAEWREQDPLVYVLLDSSRGVAVEQLEPLLYRITYGGRSVVFELNDLRNVKPPAGTLTADETFIGPIFDESAMRFFLVFNRKLKLFHYILDETIDIADQLVKIPDTDRVLIGKRTGFAYYRDHHLNRKILIGVFEGNSRVNNYYDGPFDQLPDNFIEGETLRDAILAVDPKLAGKIDRFGISPGGQDRYLIGPYRHYRTDEELLAFHDCATNKRIPPASYYECFVYDEDTGRLQADSHLQGKSRLRPGRRPKHQ